MGALTSAGLETDLGAGAISGHGLSATTVARLSGRRLCRRSGGLPRGAPSLEKRGLAIFELANETMQKTW